MSISTRVQRDAGAPPRILRRAEVLERLGLSSTTFWRMRTRGEFPAGFRLSPGLLGWLETDVDRWVEIRRGGPERAGRADPA